jgi:hypothetical protein
MIFIKRALMDDRALRATIGLSASEFNQLAQSSGPEIEKEGWNRYERGFEQGNRKIIFHSLLFQVLSYFHSFKSPLSCSLQ